MNLNYTVSTVIILLFSFKTLLSQTHSNTDTLETARQFAYSKQYSQAIDLLKAYESYHPAEVNSIRLHAQVLYWMNDYDSAFQLYEKTLNQNPNPFIKLDYARMLFELSRIQRAKEILTEYLRTDKTNIEANNMMGTISYWNGNSSKAKEYFRTVLKRYPRNEWAVKYMKEINAVTAPFLKIHADYNDDTQPLQSVIPGIETGWYLSNWLSPTLAFQFQHSKDSAISYDAYSFQLSNPFSFSKINTQLVLSSGGFKSPSDHSIHWIGGIELNKKAFHNFTITGLAERKPYLYTVSSLQNSVIQNNYAAAIGFEKKRSWHGRAAYNIQDFSDNNTIQTFSSWLLTPPIQFSLFEFRIGYANNFSNSKENRYTSVKSIQEIIAGDTMITGIYKSYFTPKNQRVHSILSNLTFKPSNSLQFILNASFGISAMADNPYLFLDKDFNNEVIINRGFTSTYYKPLSLNGKINYIISDKLILDAGYTYEKTLFYTIRNANMSLKYLFIRE